MTFQPTKNQLAFLLDLKKQGQNLGTILSFWEATVGSITPTEKEALAAFYRGLGDEPKASPTDELTSTARARDNSRLELEETKTEVDLYKYRTLKEDITRAKLEREAAKRLDLDDLGTEYLESSIDDHATYFKSARKRLRFMLPCFDQVVPLFAKNILFLGACTGEGKSSTAAQVIASALGQNNPATSKPCRVLAITNEETMSEMYTRVYFNLVGRKYSKMEEVTDREKAEAERFEREMYNSKRLIVVDDNASAIRKLTSSLEGIDHIFGSIVKNKNDYDLIVIDYFQKIRSSVEYPSMSDTDVLAKVCDRLDHYRRKLNCPIAVFGQLWPCDNSKKEFENRIKGRKMIYEVATFACEISRDFENFKTDFDIHKNRLVQDTIGKATSVGYDRDTGSFVEYDAAFTSKVLDWTALRMLKLVTKDGSPSSTASVVKGASNE